jgi:hypothetical protein
MANATGVSMKNARKTKRGSKKDRREYYVYDGTLYRGRFVLDEKTREARVFDSLGKSIGKFVGFKAAAAAIGRCAPSLKRKQA